MTSTPAEKKTAQLTAYKVLKFPAPPTRVEVSGQTGTIATAGVPVAPGITEIATVDAATPEKAIRSLVDKHGAGTYVAIPARSWKPVKVKFETKTVVKLG